MKRKVVMFMFLLFLIGLSYTEQITEPFIIHPGEKVYALVLMENPQPTSKLVLENCWATSNAERDSSPRQDLIVDRCVTYDSLTVVPLSNTQVGFTFSAFYLSMAGSFVPTSTILYLHCDTRICDTRENSLKCQQFCSSPRSTSPSPMVRYRRYAALHNPKFLSPAFNKYVRIQSGKISTV